MTGERSVIKGDFYKGAYGPTVRLVLPSIQAAVWLRQVFVDQLNRLEDRDLLLEPEMDVDHLSRLLLTASTSPNDIETTRTGDEESLAISIRATHSGWRQIADLVEPFCNGVTGHQYIGDDEGDDVLIEISFGES